MKWTHYALALLCIAVPAVAKKGSVWDVHTGDEFKNAVNQSGPVVVQFSAGWCGVCKNVKKPLEELASEMPEVSFVRVDITEVPNPGGAKVSAIPTFHYYLDGKQVDQSVGAARDFKVAMKQRINNIFQPSGGAPAAAALPEPAAQPRMIPNGEPRQNGEMVPPMQPAAKAPSAPPAPAAPAAPAAGGLLSQIMNFVLYIISMLRDLINTIINSIKGLFG